MKKCCTYLILITAVWLFLAGTVLRQQRLSSQLIRIHVVANSDSAEDQARKLQVRDAVLERLCALTEGCGDRRTAAARIIAHARELGAAAADTARQPVTVQLCPERYETRRYGGFSLPAGEYLSLQIRLGEAKGQNWWCVAFPMVCVAAAGELEAVAAAGGMGQEQIRLMTGEEADIQVRFFVLEWLERLRGRFFS